MSLQHKIIDEDCFTKLLIYKSVKKAYLRGRVLQVYIYNHVHMILEWKLMERTLICLLCNIKMVPIFPRYKLQ